MRTSGLAYCLLSIPLGASSHPVLEDRQARDFSWAVVAYAETDCRGDAVANWRGSVDLPVCLPVNASLSLAGGSGTSTIVNVYTDGTCKTVGARAVARGTDTKTNLPCYNVKFQSFTVTKKASQLKVGELEENNGGLPDFD